MRWFLRAKIHNATVTEADLAYVGSITIDEELLLKSGLQEGEKVLVADNTNGERLETYIIKGKRSSGVICMNGASAHKIRVGDSIIVMGFELSDKKIKAKNILVDGRNRFVKYL